MDDANKHELLYKFFKKFILPLSLKIFLKEINNFENMNSAQAFIVASNHASFLDPLIVGSIFEVRLNKRIFYLGKKQLLRTMPSRVFHETFGTIPLEEKDKGVSALKIATKYLKSGKIVGIFPEGMRSSDGKLLEGKTGIARLVLSAKVPVLPIAIKGTYELMPVGRLLPRFKRKVIINVGEIMHFDEHHNRGINKKTLRTITNKIMGTLKDLTSIN